MIAFITCKSSLVPLLEGLCTSNPCRFEFSVFLSFCRNRTDDLRIDSPALRPTELVLHRFGCVWSVSGGQGLGGSDEAGRRCSVCSFIVLPFPFFRSCFSKADFLASRARRGWSNSPLFVALSTPTSVQAHYFIYCVAYCCHPAPWLFDVGLLNKVNLPVPHRICAEDCIYTKCQSGLLRVCGIILLRCPWLLQFYPVLSGWIRGLDPG